MKTTYVHIDVFYNDRFFTTLHYLKKEGESSEEVTNWLRKRLPERFFTSRSTRFVFH